MVLIAFSSVGRPTLNSTAPSGSNPDKKRAQQKKDYSLLAPWCFSQDKLIYPVSVAADGNDDDGGSDGNNGDVDSIADIRTRISRF